MKKKIITDNAAEKITIQRDNVRFGLTTSQVKYRTTLRNVIVLNPREAQEIADFINENNTEYKRELQEKKLRENIERLS